MAPQSLLILGDKFQTADCAPASFSLSPPAEAEIRELLTCLQLGSDELPFIIDDSQAVYLTKKLRKHFLEYRLHVREKATGQCSIITAIGKVYASERGAYAHQVLTYLWARGLQADAVYAVPKPLGFFPEQRLLLQGKAPGTPLADSLHQPQDGGTGAGGARAAARWLAHLHNLPPEPGLAFLRTNPAAELARYRRELQAQLPTHAARLGKLFDHLLTLLQEKTPQHIPVLIHGDYHAENIFLNNGQTTVIDFDAFGWGEPAQDLGYFLAQNTIMAWLRQGTLLPAEKPGQAFLDEYKAQGGALIWSQVALYVARTFLQSLHYELCVLHTGKLTLVKLWLDLAENALTQTHLMRNHR